MDRVLLLLGVVIAICVLSHKLTEKVAIPSLLFFILLGMVFGENGIFRIHFDDYDLSNTICSTCLIFIMYYGGFGTNVKAARSVAVKSILLSTLGVAMTAAVTGALTHLILGLSWLESMLIGSVDNTASLLELESGSNDPMS